LPVVIDATRDAEADVPGEFKAVQWTRMPAGETPPGFVARVQRLLGRDGTLHAGFPRDASPAPRREAVRTSRSARRWLVPVVAAVIVLAALGVWWSRTGGDEVAANPEPRLAAVAPAVPLVGDKSVAVLPFDNLSAARENDAFADGVHHDIITHLQKIRDLKVISRTSVLVYREASSRNLRRIADELGVATVVEGTVVRVGNQVRINAALVNARTEASLWADTLVGDANDPFALQAALAQKIAVALQATLTARERTLIERRPTQSAAAYELFLRASVLDEVLTSGSHLEEWKRVAAAYQEAVVADPGFGLAYSRLTNLHGSMYWLGHLDPTPARRALAEAALRAAERIDPEAPETHYARGVFAYNCENNFAKALAHYQQAEIGLPNDVALQALMGFTHRRLGHWSDYVKCLERALALSPRFLYAAAELVSMQLELRRFEPARELAKRFVAMFPEDHSMAENLARSEFALTGDRRAFLAALEQLPRAGRDQAGLRLDYERAMWAHDFVTADRVLADPRLTGVVDLNSIINSPVALHRGLVAYLTGRREDARRFADAAIAESARLKWTPRQRPFALLDVASAHGYAGRVAEAIRESEQALGAAEHADVFGGRIARFRAGRMFATIGEHERAIEILGQLMAGVCSFTPSEIRHDPCWSRLKADPRFEEILQAARPL
jgi:TolB-like protein